MAPAEMVLIYDPSRCTACRYCEVTCSYFHFKEIDLDRSNLTLLYDPETGAREMIHCMHCSNALCLEACPTGAIYRDEETQHVRINPMKCVGCKSCIVACPVGAAWFNEDEATARKCDFCDGDPQCAKYCSSGAIRQVPRAEYKATLEKEGIK